MRASDRPPSSPCTQRHPWLMSRDFWWNGKSVVISVNADYVTIVTLFATCDGEKQ